MDVKLAGSCSQTGPHHDAHPFRRHSLLSTGSPPYGSIAEANMLQLITGDGIPCACLGRESEDASTFALCWISKSQHNACPSSPTQALVVGDLRRCPIMAVPCPQSTPTCSSWSSELGHRVVRASNDAVTRAGPRPPHCPQPRERGSEALATYSRAVVTPQSPLSHDNGTSQAHSKLKHTHAVPAWWSVRVDRTHSLHHTRTWAADDALHCPSPHTKHRENDPHHHVSTPHYRTPPIKLLPLHMHTLMTHMLVGNHGLKAGTHNRLTHIGMWSL